MDICKTVNEYLLIDNYHNNHHVLSLNYPAETMPGIKHLFHFSSMLTLKGLTREETQVR